MALAIRRWQYVGVDRRCVLPHLDHEFAEVLLRAAADDVRQLVPGVLELGGVGLGELLPQRMECLERALAGGRALAGESVGVLASGAFVEPAGLLAAAVGRGSPQRSGDLFHRDVERVVGAEVDQRDLVLRVGVPGDLRHDLLQPIRRDDGELHLHEDAGDVRLVACVRVMDGRGGLPAVDDLEVVDAADGPPTVRESGRSRPVTRSR